MERLERMFTDEREANVAKGILHTLGKDKKTYYWFDLVFTCLAGAAETHAKECIQSRDLRNIVGNLAREKIIKVSRGAVEIIQPEYVGDQIELTREGEKYLQENYPRAA